MRALVRSVWLVVALGCSSGPDLPPIAGTGADGYNVSGSVQSAFTGAPVVGASVCLAGQSSTCVLTNSTGGFVVTHLPATTHGELTATGPGLVPLVIPLALSGDIDVNIYPDTTGDVTSAATGAGATFDATTGALTFVVFTASDTYLPGATITTSPGGKVVYSNAAGYYDPTLTSTSSFSTGIVFDLPVGTANVTLSAPGVTCAATLSTGWPPTASGATASIPVVGGEETFLFVVCK